MLRSIWNGTITFGLTAVPIKVHSAIEDHGIHFHQVHAPDGARIEHRRICSKEDREVPYKEVAKGYEVRGGEYVLLAPDEVNAAAGPHSHLIEIEEFVRASDIDPVYYGHAYYLSAGEDGHDAYRLLHDALDRADRVGIGRWVFHNREYLVAVRALDQALALHTMSFADELIDAAKLELPEPSRTPAKREIEMAGALVENLHADFDPSAFTDAYRDRVRELIEAKGRGEEPDLPDQDAEPAGGTDLEAALEASLSGTKGRG